MANKRAGVGEDIMNLAAKLPWWGGVLLALVSWLVFHAIARTAPDVSGAANPRQVLGHAPRIVLATAASFLQFIAPMLFLGSAVVSFKRRMQREALVANVSRSPSSDALHAMSWREFEALVGEAFRMQGYTVTEQHAGGADGGVDLVLRKDGETLLVQCKQWKAFKVGVEVVRELYGVMAARGAAGGFVVTAGTFTEAAKEFAAGRNIRLIDGGPLLAMIQRASGSTANQGSVAVANTPGRIPSGTSRAPASAAVAAPQCPACGAGMVRRTARKGRNIGSKFWGCSRYPDCRGTR